jgi:hypothetical protein
MKFEPLLYNFVDSVLGIFKILIKGKFFLKKYQPNANSILIVGNGPSFNHTIEYYPDKLKKMPLLVVNFFANHPLFFELKPENYFLLDPAFFSDNNLTRDFINKLSEKVNWKMNVFIPYQQSKNGYFQNIIQKNTFITIYYFNYCIVNGFYEFKEFCFSKNLAHVQSQNVLVAAIFNCIQMGFKTIYLDGADHSWIENISIDQNNNDLLLNDIHFNANEKRNLTTEFNSDNFNDSNLANQLYSQYLTFKGHEIVSRYANKKQVQIFNLSYHSLIDVYKRGTYNEIVF